ncbi:MAG: 7-carboxy-7-deazaguanine synthase QueE, partial [Armatimonadota bacterium]
AQAHVAEVFASIQGEGLYVGRPQVFCRLSGCNLNCCYCDTPRARELVPACVVDLGECEAGERHINPLSARTVAALVERVNRAAVRHHSLAITGGEPMLAPGFVAELGEYAHGLGLQVYLETNGTLPGAVREAIGSIDTVALDVKLPSAVGGRDWLSEARESLKSCLAVDAFVKVVLTGETPDDELRAASAMVAGVGDVPFVLQPVTPMQAARAPSLAQVMRAVGIARAELSDVRVIPQVHRLAGWR